jgi:predicted MPP superfamily phosphohydrolase
LTAAPQLDPTLGSVFRAALWISTGLDLLAAALALLLATRLGRSGGPHEPGTTASRVAWAFAATVALVLTKLAVLVRLGLDPLFGVVHLVFLDLVVVLPAVAAGLLLLHRRSSIRATRPVLALALLACLAAPVGAYASFVEPFSLRVERAVVALPAERRGTAPIRVAVLADIQTDHVGEHERAAVERLRRRRPDVILLPGDLFQGRREAFERELPALRRLVGRLSAPGGVFFVEGDADELGRIARVVRGTQVRVLADEIVRTRVRGRVVTVAGVRLDWERPSAQRVIRRLSEARGEADVRLLLAHRPDAALTPVAGARIDLVVAGHTHGGQVQVPGFGPPVIASAVPRRVGAGGLHRIARGPWIYVSRGVGVERGQAPRMRVLAPPEISLIELGGPRPQSAVGD